MPPVPQLFGRRGTRLLGGIVAVGLALPGAAGCGGSVVDLAFTSTPEPYAIAGLSYVYEPTVVGPGGIELAMVGAPAWLQWDGLALRGVPEMISIGSSFPVSLRASVGADEVVQDFTLQVVHADEDGDGLGFLDELALGTSPFMADTDADGLTDFDEQATGDTDADGLVDALENRLRDSDRDGTVDEADAVLGLQLTSPRFVPVVVRDDRSTTARLEVGVRGSTTVESVVAINPWSDLYVEGVAQDIELFDDATHGDRLAGDGMYTRDSISSDHFLGDVGGLVGSIAVRNFVITDADGVHEIVLGTRVTLGIISRFVVREAPRELAQGVQTTGMVAGIVDAPGAAGITANLLMGPGQTGSPDAVAALRFFETFADVFDLLLLFSVDRIDSLGLGGLGGAVSNSVEGIGLPVYNNAANYGSAGTLQGVSTYPFIGGNPVTLHEVMHRWGNFLQPAFGFGAYYGDGHWGYSDVHGQLGGYDPLAYQDLGGGLHSLGSFTPNNNFGNRVPYAALEMYLMGLADPTEVPPITVLTGVSIVTGNPNTVISGTPSTVTIDDIIAAHGPRVPAYGTNQTSFHAASVVFSDRPLTADEMHFFQIRTEFLCDAQGNLIEYSFASATWGRATLNCALAEPELR